MCIRDSSDTVGLGMGYLGDLDGDGFDDMLFGARGNSDAGNLFGKAYVIYGRPSP